MPLGALGCRRVAQDEAEGAPNLVTLWGRLGELDSRGRDDGLSDLGAGGIPWKARNYWLEDGAGRGNRTLTDCLGSNSCTIQLYPLFLPTRCTEAACPIRTLN